MRPLKVPEEGIDWTFFRENPEGGYAIGSYGLNITDDLAVDFTVATQEGCGKELPALHPDMQRRITKAKFLSLQKQTLLKQLMVNS